jgi:hypothetical protein
MNLSAGVRNGCAWLALARLDGAGSSGCALLESPLASADAARAEVVRTKSRRESGSEREQIFMVRVEFLRACFKNPVRMRDAQQFSF